jgi:type II secretory pathway pseudopilin PulG
MKLADQGTRREACSRSDDQGYAMAVVLVAMAILGLWTAALLPTWRQQGVREKEYELAFRGEQYARAIALYQRQYRAFPPDVDALANAHTLRKKWKDPITGEDFVFVMGSNQPGVGGTSGTGNSPGGSSFSNSGTGSRGATPPAAGLAAGAGQRAIGTPAGGTGQPSQGSQGAGLQGVQSKSTAASYRIYNGASHYNEWQFRATLPAPAQGAQGPAGGGPGGRGGPGTQGGPQGPAGGGRGGPQGPGGGRGGTPPVLPGGGRGRGGI